MKKALSYGPLEKRIYKLKNPALSFFCPLCRTERAITIRPRLRSRHFLQMIFLTAFFMWSLWPLMRWGGLLWFFIIWACFEAVIRISFRKEVPCPHCGFDASWYKKDVKMARKLVHEFWEHKKI